MKFASAGNIIGVAEDVSRVKQSPVGQSELALASLWRNDRSLGEPRLSSVCSARTRTGAKRWKSESEVIVYPSWRLVPIGSIKWPQNWE